MSPLLAVLQLPAWVGYGIVGAAVAACLVFAVRWFQRDAKLEAEYLPAPGTWVKVAVRGLAATELARFARCWNQAFDCISMSGPWPRATLLERLGPGNKVQVMPVPAWESPVFVIKDGKQVKQMVGGELIAGVLRVCPDLSSLCHELIHRCEAVLQHGETDNDHLLWKARGLSAADESYRAWLAKPTGART